MFDCILGTVYKIPVFTAVAGFFMEVCRRYTIDHEIVLSNLLTSNTYNKYIFLLALFNFKLVKFNKI